MQPKADTVRAVNRLTRRWAEGVSGQESTVFSAPSLWPLLALLADPAAGPAREELEDAVGVRAEEAVRHAHDLLDAFASLRGTRTALGLWSAEHLALRPEWTLRLPPGVTGRLDRDPEVSRQRLDAWASQHTEGLIPSMPLKIDPDTLLVLAGAQLVRTKWLRPFRETLLWTESGPWRGRELLGLHRFTSLLDRVAVAETPCGPLTVLRILGNTGVDVHLVLGPANTPPAQVLAHAVDTLPGQLPAGRGTAGRTVPGHARTGGLPRARLTSGDRLPPGQPGPGLTVSNERSTRNDPQLDLTTSPFRIAVRHDLMAHAARFGLSTASDRSRGHFPGLAPHPLAIQDAAQAAVAVFDAKGFESAAVSMLPVAAGSAPPPPRHTVRHIEAAFDRPFAFLTVHRTSHLILNAGWITDPTPYPERMEPWD